MFKSKVFLLLITILFMACGGSGINLKTFPKVKEGNTSNDAENITELVTTSLPKTQLKINFLNNLEWKNIRVLYNEYNKVISFRNPNIEKEEILLLKDEAILVSDILEQLYFNNEIEFFDFLRDYKEGGYIYRVYKIETSEYKYIYGIAFIKEKKNKKKDTK